MKYIDQVWSKVNETTADNRENWEARKKNEEVALSPMKLGKIGVVF